MKKQGTVCFIVRDGRVLLALIEYPNGTRLWNGIGGVVDSGETPAQAVVREISEETMLSVNAKDVHESAVIDLGELDLHVFISKNLGGDLKVIDPTLKELKWFDFADIPYSQMHTGNSDWLPGVLGAS